jgi:phosphoribosylformylglycinamidine synthase subunit PurQ / glutaminase
MKFGVVQFPGSNCDDDAFHAIGSIIHEPVEFIWHQSEDLKGSDCIILPGGFAYGDYLRTGAIAKVSPVVNAIVAHARRGGYVLGVCNGFQILTEVGLLAGALTRNLHQRFECGDWFVKVTAEGPFTPTLGNVWRLPVAHGEGRFQADADTLRRLEGEGLVGLRYCTAAGAIEPTANPNGSIDSIAGIYGGPRRNVFGLMPHPERMSEAVLGCADGRKLFERVLSQVA